MKRRAVCIFHPYFDPDTAEAVEFAAMFCSEAMSAGKSVLIAMLEDVKNDSTITDDQAQSMINGFNYRVMKVDV